MRSIEEIKRVKDQRPFKPFFLHLADGRQIPVNHPDVVSWDEGSFPRTVFVIHEGDWDILDLTLISSVRIPGPLVDRP